VTRNTTGVAFMAAGPGTDALVPFAWDGVDYLVPGRELRHLHPDCRALQIARQHEGWVDRVQNNPELRVATVRCTAGCWDAYEKTEARKATRGDEAAGLDQRIDAVERRAAFAARVDRGEVRGAVRDG
jgi:hypothetical protein